jgi:trans-aconitate 2-methyltransferase
MNDINNSELYVPEKKWDASLYAETHQLQGQISERFFFSRFQWKGDEIILDIGSGDGKCTARIAKSVSNGAVQGWDNSSSMIAYSQSNYSTDIYPNLVFKNVDASQFNSYSNTSSYFDLVVSFHALHWMDDQLEVLKGIAYALKPGGKAYLLVTSKGFDPILVIVNQLIVTKRWESYFKGFCDPLHRFSVSQYTHLLELAGLVPCSVVEVLENDLISSRKELRDQIRSWLPHLKVLPNVALQEQFLDEMVEEFMKTIFPGQSEPSYLTDCNLEIIAEKPV